MPEETSDVARIVEEFPESFGLTKNSKGYTWEIKVRARYGKIEEALDRVESINKLAHQKFGEEPPKQA